MSALPTHPSFAETYRNSADPGSDFHRFVGEVFAVETVGLTSFLAPGKDGAIDLYDPTHKGVYECKFVGNDGQDAIYPRWREVEKHLTDNLLPGNPKTGAAQYRPWYDVVHPIRHYRFCVSARFANKAQADQLAQQIREVFTTLAGRAGLAHLRDIVVEVWSWDRFEPMLSTRTGLRLRWLGRGLPNGVQEFSRAQERQRPGFQAYLHGNDKLKYVPIDDALAPAALLATLVSAEQASAVIHGRGGAGKSRLLIEIGRAAQEAGWVVLQVQADTVTPDSLATLVRECGEAKLLLLMDYVERCANWDAWMFALQDFVSDGATVRLLGTCRDSWRERLDFYQSFLLALPAALDTTVRGMLAQRPDLLPMAERCEGVPVFAAFLCLLYDTKQHAVLESLRGQTDFGRWLQQHIARLPVAQNVLPGARELALVELLISLPCCDAALQALEHANPVAASYRAQLHEDGWLTYDMTAPEAERWAVVHDVLADGAFCRWLGAQAQAADPHLQRWLNAARQRGSLPPMLAALQRVARESAVQARPWHQIFEAKPGSLWLSWMDAILRTHLLEPLEALAWLDRLGANSANNVGSRAVQVAVGDAIEQARKVAAGGAPLANGQEASLCRWVDAVAVAFTGVGVWLPAQASNHVLTRALSWRPARYAAASARWLDAHAEQEQAQFLLNTWLAVGEPSCGRERARPWGERWLNFNGLRWVASFVFKAWLNAKGDLELVRGPIQNWLAQEVNALSPDAEFVFKAWLDAKGELALVREHIQSWLGQKENALSPEASYIFKAWLDAKGELALVREHIQSWLGQKENALSPEASYIFKAWLDAKGDLAEIDAAVQAWISVPEHAKHESTGFVIRAYGDRDRHLPHWLIEPASAWVRAWHRDQDAVYPLKYVASVPTLDVETLQAVLDWCQHYPRHKDALSRLSRALQAQRLGELPDRVRLFEIAAQVIDATVAQSRASDLTSFNLLAGLSSLAKLNRLPTRNAAERASAQFLPSRVCALLRLIPDVGMLEFHTLEYFFRELLVSTDWEGLVERAFPLDVQLNQALKNGLSIWIEHCRPWSPTERHRNALDRLVARTQT